MILRKSILSEFAFIAAVSGVTLAYYVALMIYVNLTGSTDATRLLTIPFRVGVVALFLLGFLLSANTRLDAATKWFLAFSLIYYLRIALEWLDGGAGLYRSPQEFFLYYTSFVFLPYLFLANTRISESLHQKLFWLLTLVSLVLGLLTLNYYGTYLGEVSRISQAVRSEDNYISPLALSYSAALTFVTLYFYYRSNTVTAKGKVFLAATALVAVPQFLLGASRGSVVALLLTVTFFIMFDRAIVKRLRTIFMFLVAAAGAIFLADIYGSGVFERIFRLQADIDAQSSSVIRLIAWTEGWGQFLEAPLFGNSLQSEFLRHHPHNIFIEVLISTGIVGFIFFIGFLLAIFKRAIYLVRYRPQVSWVVTIFLVGFSENLFSGSISTATTLVVGAGIIVSLCASQPRITSSYRKE